MGFSFPSLHNFIYCLISFINLYFIFNDNEKYPKYMAKLTIKYGARLFTTYFFSTFLKYYVIKISYNNAY